MHQKIHNIRNDVITYKMDNSQRISPLAVAVIRKVSIT